MKLIVYNLAKKVNSLRNFIKTRIFYKDIKKEGGGAEKY